MRGSTGEWECCGTGGSSLRPGTMVVVGLGDCLGGWTWWISCTVCTAVEGDGNGGLPGDFWSGACNGSGAGGERAFMGGSDGLLDSKCL